MTAAQLATRVNHSIQPTSKPAKRPNAARVYRYAPPVPSKRLATSAKVSAMSMETRPVAPTIHGLHAPVFAATAAGRPNTAAPMTWLTPMAVKSHRPNSRLRPGALRSSVVDGTSRLYHFRSGETRRIADGSTHRSRQATRCDADRSVDAARGLLRRRGVLQAGNGHAVRANVDLRRPVRTS